MIRLVINYKSSQEIIKYIGYRRIGDIHSTVSEFFINTSIRYSSIAIARILSSIDSAIQDRRLNKVVINIEVVDSIYRDIRYCVVVTEGLFKRFRIDNSHIHQY